MLLFFGAKKSVYEAAQELAGSVEPCFIPYTGNSSAGETPNRMVGLGYEFWQFRPYVQGDKPQDIDWKRSARSDEVLLRDREAALAPIINLMPQVTESLDYSSSGKIQKKIDAVEILTFALGIWAERQNCRLQYFGEKITANDIEEKVALPLLPSRHSRHGNNAISILCGDFIEAPAQLEKLFNDIQNQRTVLIQCLDPAEIDFPFAGRIEFSNSHQKALIKDAAVISDQYRQKIQAQISFCEDYAYKRGWLYQLIRTDQDLKSLFRHATEYIAQK